MASFLYTATAIGGGPESGALCYVFTRGTTTPAVSYSDSGLTTPTLNPIVADADGRIAPAYFDDSLDLTFRVKTADRATNLLRVDFRDGVFSVTYAQIDQLTLFEEDDTSDGAQTHVLTDCVVDNPWGVRILFDGVEQPVANYSVVTDGTDTTVTYATNCQPATGVRVLYKSAVLQALSPAAIDYSTIDISAAKVTPTGGTEDTLADHLAAKLTSSGGDGSAVVVTPEGANLSATIATYLNKPGIRVGAFTGADPTGVASSDAAALAAIAYAKSSGIKKVIFDAGRWLINNDRLLNFETTGGIEICGEGMDRTTIVHATNTELFLLNGTDTDIGSGIDVTVASNIGDDTFTVADTSALTVGQYVILQDPTQTVTNYEDMSAGSDFGQMTRVRAKPSGTSLQLEATGLFAYSTSSEVRALGMVDGFTLEDFTIEASGSNAPNVVSLFQVAKIAIRRVRFKGQRGDCIRTDDCADGDIDSCQFLDLVNESGNNPYGINLARGTQGFRVSNCFQRGGRHLITNVGSTTSIESADHVISGCMAIETSSAGFDTHHNARNWNFTGNITSMAGKDGADRGDGIQIRGRWCTVNGHQSFGCYRGVSIYYCDRNRVLGGMAVNCAIGVDVTKAPYTEISGYRIHNPTTKGVTIATGGAAMPGLRLYDIEVIGDPSGNAFETNEWLSDWRIRDLVADTATNKFSGFPNSVATPSVLYLTGSGNLARPPVNCTSIEVEVVGPGGGGGGGARVASGSACSGGGGGGAGSRATAVFKVSDLTWPVAYSVGTGGGGGTGATSNGVAGGNGSSGGTTSFGGTPYLRAFAGGGGAGGQLAGASGGGGGGGAYSAGAASTSGTGGSAGNTTGVAGGSGASANTNTSAGGGGPGGGGPNSAAGGNGGSAATSAAGGGAGGGISTAPAAFDGGVGGRANGTYTAPAGGTAAGAGTAGGSPLSLVGPGGAGGASNTAGVGGAGGSGGVRGGGGGGGGSAVGANGGAGGAGGDGIIVVRFFYE